MHNAYIYMKKQDENSMMYWSTNFIIAIITQPTFRRPCRLSQWYNVNRQEDNKLTKKLA